MLLDELLYVKMKGDVSSHAVRFELETSSSGLEVNTLGIQQYSCRNLFVLLPISVSKLSPKLDRQLQCSSCSAWWELQVLSLLESEAINSSVWGNRVSMKMNMKNSGSKPK